MATEAERMKMVDALEKAASNVVDAKRELADRRERAKATPGLSVDTSGPTGRINKWQKRLVEAWQAFPECRDEHPPSAGVCLDIVRRIRDEIEADRQFAESLTK